jgi:mono/diheme cytochrome c family protein
VSARDLGVGRLLQIFAALSVALLAVLVIAPARSYFTEWRAAQKRYNAASGTPVPVEIKQVWKPELDIVDRCGSCHLATVGAEPIAGDPLYAAHPPIPHDPRELGCTVCHGGQGRATRAADAHGRVEHWSDPLLPRGSEEAGCGTCHSGLRVGSAKLVEQGKKLFAEGKCAGCHDGKHGAPDLGGAGLHGFRPDWHARHVEHSQAAKDGPWATDFVALADVEVNAVGDYLHTLVGAPKLMAAKTLAYRRGCRGCHRIGGVGGDDGPDLSDEGHKAVENLPDWLKRHFLDPPRVTPGSQMPNLALTDSEAAQLTLYMLSLRARVVPEASAPRDRLRTERLGERDFATDGESLFGVFCAACHGPRGEGRKFPGLAWTFPAIGDADFLGLADDPFLRKTLTDGRPGRRMPAWGTKDGGLRPEEIDAIVGFLRSLEPAAPAFEAVMAAPIDAAAGTKLFGESCAPCHGRSGEGSAIAPPLAARDNPVTHDDNRIYGTVTVGVAGTAMGSFRRLDAPALRSLIATVRALPPVETSRAGWAPISGDAARGGAEYARSCARCHGDRLEGKEGPALGNAAFLAAAGDGYLTATIIRGRGTTTMPHFGVAGTDHPQLESSTVADLVAFLRSKAPKK